MSARKQDENTSTADLRLASRQAYLQKREAEQLALLRQQVAEEAEEERTSRDQLSKNELQQFARNRELLRLAESRLSIDEHLEGYNLPEDYITEQGRAKKRKIDTLNERYVEKDEFGREKFVTEHEEWEKEQAAKAKSWKKAEVTRAEDYEFVFDEEQTIRFVSDKGAPAKTKTQEQIMFEARVEAEERKVMSIEEGRKKLPMYKHKEPILDAIDNHPVLILVGETGSGKSTQIPQYIYERFGKASGMRLACTQPRRVAAMSVAARVAEEMGVKLGKEVGYKIRFEDKTSDDTKVCFMTDGLLLREVLSNPDLPDYGFIIIDEAHERTVATDILLALVKDLSRLRPDLRVVISSATLNAQAFSTYFDDAPIYFVEGRTFPVTIYNTPAPEANYLQAACTTIFQVHVSQPPGDILVFLTGQDEIEAAQESIEETAKKLGSRAPELIVCPIYANLPTDLQAKIFEPTPPKARKVVLATNIAETSLTIDGIVYVIDSGFSKEMVYNPRTSSSSLVVTPISRASANQRAGRAGRVGPGYCFRLFTKWSFFNEMPAETAPEMQRINLTNTVLLLKSLGIDNLLEFDFPDPPPAENLSKALESLYALGALSASGEVTKLGRQMSEFPLDPTLSKAIITADLNGCTEEVCSIVAMLDVASEMWYRPKDKKVHADAARRSFTIRDGGDMMSILNVWEQWVAADYSYVWAKQAFLQPRSLNRARDVRDQLMKLLERVGLGSSSCGINDVATIKKCIVAGFFLNSARLQRDGQSYRTTKNPMTVFIHPSSSLIENTPATHYKWVCYHELVTTSKDYMRQVIPVTPELLAEAAPHYHKMSDLEKLGVDKKMPKTQGKSTSGKL